MRLDPTCIGDQEYAETGEAEYTYQLGIATSDYKRGQLGWFRTTRSNKINSYQSQIYGPPYVPDAPPASSERGGAEGTDAPNK